MRVCVFCGSSPGANICYAHDAKTLARLLTESNCALVFGGGNIGLMGILADGVIQNGGEVIGVIPDFLVRRELAHKGISRLEVVSSMHERKQRMADLADAFIALPGGWGTLDELAEILTWRQLGLINKPVGLLNTNGFFDTLLAQMQTMVNEGFLQQEFFSDLVVANAPGALLGRLRVALS